MFTSKLRDDFENSDTKTIGEVVDDAFENISENKDVGKFQNCLMRALKTHRTCFQAC